MYIQSKKALSIIVGYVLLIVFASVVGVIVYKWQATYVPQDEYAACPEGASLFIDNINYDCTNDELTFDVTNNGKFSIGGYFIYVKDAQEKTIATLEISNNNTDTFDPKLSIININGIKLGLSPENPLISTENDFLPGAKESERYTMVGIVEPIYGIEIVPIRWQQEGRKEVLASCKEVRITEPISGCGAGLCVDDGQACVGRECGTVMNNCYEYVECGNPCEDGEFCDSEGQCVTSIMGEEEIPASCDGTWEGAAEDIGVVCDGGVLCESNCACPPGSVPDYIGNCMYVGGSQSCIEYCLDQNRLIGTDYTSSGCTQNSGQCTGPGNGDYLSGGDYQCIGAPTGSYCCCFPQQ